MKTLEPFWPVVTSEPHKPKPAWPVFPVLKGLTTTEGQEMKNSTVWVLTFSTIWGRPGNYELKFSAPRETHITHKNEPDTKILDQKLNNLRGQFDAVEIDWSVKPL